MCDQIDSSQFNQVTQPQIPMVARQPKLSKREMDQAAQQMLDDMQFLDSDSDSGHSSQEDENNIKLSEQERLNFMELQDKYFCRPDLFQFTSAKPRCLKDMIIGFHKALRLAFENLTIDQENFLAMSR